MMLFTDRDLLEARHEVDAMLPDSPPCSPGTYFETDLPTSRLHELEYEVEYRLWRLARNEPSCSATGLT